MYSCPKEVWAEVAELPKDARRLWRRAFWRAWPKAAGDGRRAAALAWQAFALEAKGGGAALRSPGKRDADERQINKAVSALLAKFRAILVLFRSFLGLPRGRESSPMEDTQQPFRPGYKGRGSELERFGQRNLEEVFAEAVAQGWLKPEQRPWAEALARRDGQALQEFFKLAATAAKDEVAWDGWRSQRDDMT